MTKSVNRHFVPVRSYTHFSNDKNINDFNIEDMENCTVEQFAEMLDTLELMPYRNTNAAVAVVQKALILAEKLDNEELSQRTRLIQSDVMARQGKVAEAGRIMFHIHQWAEQNEHAHILARSHRLIAGFYRRVGDNESALQHAIAGLRELPDTAPPSTRADHLMMLALTLDEVGAYEDSERRFQEVLMLATLMDDTQLLMFALNNMAYTRYEMGQAEEAYRLITKLRELATRKHVELGASQLDTIAQVEILLGQPAKAEQTLAPVVNDPLSRKLGDLMVLPECLLTTAEAQRHQGKLIEAQATLDEARHLCHEHGLPGLMVRALLQQSELYAAAGDYRSAYEEHKRYHEAGEKLRSSEREARARIMQIAFDAEEARRDSELFRELALRDPLTGLHNRRYIEPYMDGLLEESFTQGKSVTAILIDLDHFKTINDTLSHQVGDTVLVHLAKILSLTAPSSSALARIGGEEFLAVLPDTDAAEGLRQADKLCQAIHSADWSSITGNLPVTASLGVSTMARVATNRTELLALADHRLYQAKHSGRNCVVGDSL
ncbi:tetratricopeptide repeat-containing diguanylate cyclase [Paenibacillus wulumuqiensis]|uniref:tetratricopeptide repeat-containing diguanylate cyclase n=1 Tax=Paenibacillus wulumuqiensis TaxID=1567107 RepID=UPI00061927E1|nr:diguanylate cyclase [Paenibacillus wulumuqiensis]